MHKGRRINIPIIEESGHNWRRVARIDSEDLQGRPTKVLRKFVDTGRRRHWWDPASLRTSKEFRWLIKIVWGEEFLRQLEKLNGVEVKENGD